MTGPDKFGKQTVWFVPAFNACWSAGLNNCNAEKVIDCKIGATINTLRQLYQKTNCISLNTLRPVRKLLDIYYIGSRIVEF